MSTTARQRIALSQNFLKTPRLARSLVVRSSISGDDTVIEIGSGKGVLTRQLAEHCHQVIAVEKDRRLATRLGADMRGRRNVVVYQADFLELPLPATPYKVFANIPFNVTSEIVGKLTRSPNPPEDAYLVMQREASARFLGDPQETLYSVLLKPWFALSEEYRFQQRDFVPPPRVSVVLLRFNKRGPPLVPSDEDQRYRDFVVYGFTAWKPNIRAAFEEIASRAVLSATGEGLADMLHRKPSNVPFEHWLALYRHLRNRIPSSGWRRIEGAERRLREQQEGLSKSHRSRASGRGS